MGHPDEVEEIFDLISYSKGASVIRMLYNWIGDEVRSILEYAGVYDVLLECASVLQSITRYASIRIYIYIPHSASNNRTTTCGSRVNALVGSGKRPPAQVTIGPPHVAVE